VQYIRGREGQNIPTLEGPRRKAVMIEEKDELLRSTGFPTPPQSKEKDLPIAGNIHNKISQEILQKASFK
jgi:hypothetical protein